MNTFSWYASLIKPSFAPPAWVFGPVWSVLYVLIAVSFGALFLKAVRGEVPWAVAVPFVINLIANALFTYIQMQLLSNGGALADIAVIWGSIVWAMVWVYPYAPWIAYMQIPYLVWVSFAGVLQASITYLNW